MCIRDRDHVVAAAGVSKKEYLERRVTSLMEELMETRRGFVVRQGDMNRFVPVEGIDKAAVVAYPILAAGDVTGAVILLNGEQEKIPGETEIKLAQTAAAFLGKQMEE